MFVIWCEDYREYYLGKYIHDGEVFPCFVPDINLAKKWKTRKNVERGLDIIKNSLSYLYDFKIVEIDK